MGPNDITSRTCISKGACDPIGGQSVWTSIGDLTNNNKIILVNTKIDSIGDFYSLAPGTISVSAGVSTLIGMVKGMFDATKGLTLTHNYIFGFFQGESWGYLGGRKLFFDIQNFECKKELSADKSTVGEKICLHPIKLSLQFKNIKLSNIESVISLDQLIDTSNPNNLYLHGETNNEYYQNINKLAQSITGNIKMTATTDKGIPPSFASTLLKSNTITNAYVISGYNTQYVSTYNSMCDNPNSLSIDGAVLAQKSKFLTTLLLKLGEGESLSSTYDPTTLVKNLFYCLSYNNSCGYLDMDSLTRDVTTEIQSLTYADYPSYLTGVYSVYLLILLDGQNACIFKRRCLVRKNMEI